MLTLNVCVDCAMLIANGELPPDNDQFNLLPEWEGWHLALDCPEDCDGGFTWSRCEGCGDHRGGDRHPAVAFEI